MLKIIHRPSGIYPRRTGRTFRRLLRAFVKASEGNNVLYVSQDVNMSEWSFNQALNIISSYLNIEENGSAVDRVIKFPTNGTVTFITQQQLVDRRYPEGFTSMKVELIHDED